MIKVSVMYPNSTEATFDLSYYRDRHMPMAHERLGDACKGTAIDIGLGGGAPGSTFRPRSVMRVLALGEMQLAVTP